MVRDCGVEWKGCVLVQEVASSVELEIALRLTPGGWGWGSVVAGRCVVRLRIACAGLEPIPLIPKRGE